MAEHWKSTPSYWCKFCSVYVRDTPIERKNHEASGRHQGGIQKSLREIHKEKSREERDKQRAKDEVARLNGLVGGKASPGVASGKPTISGLKDVGRQASAPAPSMSAAAQRKLHAEQLVAMGVALPEELKKEVTGVGSWQTVAETVVEDAQQPWSLADIKAEENIKAEEDSKDDIKVDSLARGVHKRKVEDDEEEAAASKRRTWGSSVKTYPGSKGENTAGEDLDALLGGLTKKKKTDVKEEGVEAEPAIKREESTEDASADVPSDVAVQTSVSAAEVKQEEDTAPAVVFKKRKGKR